MCQKIKLLFRKFCKTRSIKKFNNTFAGNVVQGDGNNFVKFKNVGDNASVQVNIENPTEFIINESEEAVDVKNAKVTIIK